MTPTPKLLSEMKTIGSKKRNGGFLSDREFRIEWEKLRTRVEKTRRTAKKKWLTAVVDLKTRIIVHYIITDKRPDNKEIYRLVKTSAVVAGMPTDIITDCYGAYKPAIGRLEREMKRHGGSVNHILVRSKDQSTLHLKAKKSKKGVPRHNNHIESMWSKVKKNMDIMSGYGEYNSDSIISYNIINHNFIRPHSSLEAFVGRKARAGQRDKHDARHGWGVPKVVCHVHRAADRVVGVRQVVCLQDRAEDAGQAPHRDKRQEDGGHNRKGGHAGRRRSRG